MHPPLNSLTVARPLLSFPHCVCINLVGCCVQFSIGGRLKQQQIMVCVYFLPRNPMVEKIRRVLPYCQRAVRPLPQIFPNEPVAFWLVVVSSSHPAEAIKIRGPVALSILIFLSHISSPKRTSKRSLPCVPPGRVSSKMLPQPPTPSLVWLLRRAIEQRPFKAGAPPIS